MTLKILQINAMRSSFVMAELRKRAEEMEADLLCIQEPYMKNGKLAHFPPDFRYVFGSPNAKSIIVVINNSLTINKISELCSEHSASIAFRYKSSEWILTNIYAQYSDHVEPYIQIIKEAESYAHGKSLLTTADINSKSALWFSRYTDDRGEKVSDTIQELDLFVANRPGQPETYHNRAGAATNIDITLTNRKAANKISEWTVHSGLTSSDHNTITFIINDKNTTDQTPITAERFNLKKANWNKL